MLKLTLIRCSALRLASTECTSQAGKKEQGAIPYIHDDLVGVVGSEFGHWRAHHSGLRSRVVKVHRLRSRLGLHVVNTAQKIVGVAVRRVSPRRCEDVPQQAVMQDASCPILRKCTTSTAAASMQPTSSENAARR